MNPIELAVLPLKTDAIQSARDRAAETVGRFRAELEAADWDERIVAPYPKSMATAYMAALRKYKTLQLIAEWDYQRQPGPRGIYGPSFVVLSANRVEKFIADAGEFAAVQYDVFVAKLVAKIGVVKAATLEGNHVWDYSILNVIKDDDTVECWKTQQIWNVSKLGLDFPQWPTRKIKNIA